MSTLINIQIKWVTDYLIKCHTGPTELYGQTGSGHQDHSYWGRPEEYPFARQVHKVNASNPGSDLAAETAAALAAASIVYSNAGNAEESQRCLQHAIEIYNFADQYRGTYTSGIGDASSFYNSWSGYQDELIWGAAWLAKATGDASYLSKAENYYDSYNGAAYEPYSWDNKKLGAQIVLYEVSGKWKYKNTIETNVNAMRSNGPYTPGGMIYLQEWGPARHAANAGFIAAQAAVNGIKANGYTTFVREQVDYLLGSNPQNQCFIVGLGSNCPTRPHHRSSSCPASGSCDGYQNRNADNPMVRPSLYLIYETVNFQILYGALVGGPNQNDQYNDDRGDYIANEVATDYNAIWQGCLAYLVQSS